MPEPQSAPVPPAPEPELDPAKVEALRRRLVADQRLFPAVLGGLAAALVGAAIWAAVTVATRYHIGWMAVGVGFLVGFTVRMLGKGITPTYGILGAALALVGCLLGNLLSACGLAALESPFSFWTVVSWLDLEFAIDLLKATFRPMDLLFYGIAAWEGYKFSFRQVTPDEARALAREHSQP